MRHIVQNSVISVSADSENPSFPATALLDLHPKRKFRAAVGVGTATVTADVSGGCSDILVAGTNAATASIVAVDPNATRWASDSWGMGGALSAAVNAIIATTANLVDVFVYNTYEDYDGGAWTEDANYQSWYIEPLNTATRGAKREFPKVALIVAETTKVTIYDATETDCPMWRVYAFTGLEIKAVAALNGVISVALATKTSVINLLADTTTDYTTSSTPAIVNNACNDVAMTTISRTENAYGLLDPVIAVFTDGGVSVIDGSAGVGTVVDSSSTLSAFQGCITDDGHLFWGRGNINQSVYWSQSPITSIVTDGFTTDVYSAATIPALQQIGSATTGIAYGKDSVVIGKSNQLTLLAEDTTTPANGMVSYITTSYNTGWMKGDIRRAIICEAEGTTETLTSTTITDRSVKASSMTVNGSLTRSPVATGAELQALSGFSTSNYLNQAYSADLDFGTGDFHICGWLKEASNSALEVVLARAAYSGSYSGSGYRVYVSSAGFLTFHITDDGFTTADLIASTAVVDDSTWKFFVAQRVGNPGNLELWINDSKAATDVVVSQALLSLTNASATLLGGVGYGPASPLTNGSLAPLRIGAGSLTSEQISKMYREELALFQASAKCTIQGASSAVTALAFDDGKQLLHVGTSDGVTTFFGLEAVATTYDDGLTVSSDIKALSAFRGLFLAGTVAQAYAWLPPSYSTPVAHFASGEELDISGTVTQRSKSESLWIQLSEPVLKPCILSITLSSGTATLEAGVLSAGLAETYGTANPNYGLSSTMIDYSIEEENSNGSYYYKKRDIVRSFDGTATMTRDSAFTMLDSYELIGKNPSGWKLTDMDGNEWVVFGKFGASPEVSHDYPSHSNVSFSIIEVF